MTQVVQHSDRAAFAGYSKSQKIQVTKETQTTVANLANGVFSPLDGFVG